MHDQSVFCAFYTFLEVQMNADYINAMMRNNNQKITIAGYSSRPQQHQTKMVILCSSCDFPLEEKTSLS